MPRTTTIDLQDRIDEIDEELAQLGDEIAEVQQLHDRLETFDASDTLADHGDVADALAAIVAGGDTDVDVPGLDGVTVAEVRSLLDEQYQALKLDERELERARDRIEAETKRWGGSDVTIKEFNYGAQGMRNDLVRGDQLQKEHNNPEANLSALKLRTVQVGTQNLPPDAPNNPKEFEPPVGEYLYRCIDNLNTYGEVSLPDFSL